jgi:hypothetical protein
MLRGRRIRSTGTLDRMQPPLDRPHPALVHRQARRFRLRPLALGGVLAAGAAPLFLGLTGIAALSDEGPHEALEVVLLLLLLRFSFLPLAFSLLGSNLATKCATHSGTWAVG